ncbi:hypothetical protein DMH04_35465, partial [Kibdelosporangium aridum]
IVVHRSGNRMFVRMSHPLYSEVVNETMGHAMGRVVAGELATALTSEPMRRSDDALRAGTWQLRAGRQGNPEILLTAAAHAVRRLDNTLARKLAQAARDSGGGWSADNALAQILSHMGRFEEALGVLSDVPGTTDISVGTQWAIARSDILFWGLGKADEAERTLIEVGTAPRHWSAEASRGFMLLFDSRCADALRIGEAVLGCPDSEPRALVWAAGGAIAAAGILGQQARAQALYRRGFAVAVEHPDEHTWRMHVCTAYCVALLAMGFVNEASALAEREFQGAMAGGTKELAGVWAGFRGAVAKARGDLATAGAALRESLTLLAGYDTFRMAAPCLAEVAGAWALGGDGNRADRFLVRANSAHRRPSRLFLPWMELDRAWTQASLGDVGAAATTALKAADLARHASQPTIEAWALYDAARLGNAGAVQKRLAELASTLQGTVVTVFAQAAAALADGDGERLWHAAESFCRLGLHLHAAEVAGSANKASRSAALTKWRAAEFLGRCPHARTPLLDTTRPSADLTRRERDVVTLAAAGQSSKQIAAQLGLSVRTVDNHLSRAYTKLGIHGRDELPPALD